MKSRVYHRKRLHGLHLARSSAEFIDLINAETADSAGWHPGRFVNGQALVGTVLGGSIPVGTATAASDVDLIAFVRASGDVPTAFPRDDDIVFAAYRPHDRFGATANVIVVVNGVEIDTVFLPTDWLRSAQVAVAAPAADLSVAEIDIFGKIKRGWALEADADLRQLLGEVRDSSNLEIRTCVSTYVYALKFLEDALAAMADNLPLALYLGRLCIERCFQSYYAANGHVLTGDKWLRLARRDIDRSTPASGPSLYARGERLLFPAFDLDAASVAAYLGEVKVFANAARAAIEGQPAHRAAFRLCPQIDAVDAVVSFVEARPDE
jgi:hypothetical protein